MSKFKGNVIDLLDWVEMFGVDVLWFMLVCGVSFGGDLVVSEDVVWVLCNFGIKLFNVIWYVLFNGVVLVFLLLLNELIDVDCWIFGRLEEVWVEVDLVFDGYEFSCVCEFLYYFVWDEFCDWYFELVKM